MAMQSNLQERYERILDLSRSVREELDTTPRNVSHLQELRSRISRSINNLESSIPPELYFSLSLVGLSVLILGVAYVSFALIFYILLQ
jgi:predicted  nucleic acid-binding Zn-ribbon protein